MLKSAEHEYMIISHMQVAGYRGVYCFECLLFIYLFFFWNIKISMVKYFGFYSKLKFEYNLAEHEKRFYNLWGLN